MREFSADAPGRVQLGLRTSVTLGSRALPRALHSGPEADMRVLPAALLLASLGGPGIAADDDELASARSEFEILESRRPVADRSPARVLRDFLSHEPAVVLRVEEEAWDAWHDPTRIAFTRAHGLRIEDTIRALHDLPARFARRNVPPGEQTGPAARPMRGPLAELLRGHPLRQPPDLRAQTLLADAAALNAVGGEALGEACARDDDAFAELCRRAAAAPDDDVLLTALGWSARAAAADLLAARVARIAGDPTLDAPPTPSVRAAVAALAHADLARLDALLDGLPTERAELLASFVADDVIVLRRLRVVDRAGADPAARRAALVDLVRPVAVRVRAPGGAGALRLVRALLDACHAGDVALRDASVRFATKVFLGWDRQDGSSGERIDVRFSSYRDPYWFLRDVADDLAAGRIEFARNEPGLFEHGPPTPWNVRTTVTDANPAPSGDAPIAISGERTKDGSLLIRLRNSGASPIAIDPAGLRYGWARRSANEVRSPVKPAQTETVLTLTLHGLGGTVVRTSALVTLAPGAMYEFEMALRGDLRPTEHVDIELDDDAPIVGDEATPVVTFLRTRLF
jgi:hypothetical protein